MKTEAQAAGGGGDRKERVYAMLRQAGVPFETVDHPPLFSQADNEKYRLDPGATIFKNLFLRNKNKSRYYLLALPLEKRANLQGLQKILGETKLSFGDEAALAEKLNIQKGSVSILNMLETDNRDVTLLIDEEIYRHERFGVHPNDNTATVILSPQAIPAIMETFQVRYRFVSLSPSGAV